MTATKKTSVKKSTKKTATKKVETQETPATVDAQATTPEPTLSENPNVRRRGRPTPRSEAPDCGDGEMLVRDAEMYLRGNFKLEVPVRLGSDEEVTWVRGNKAQMKDILFSSRGLNDKVRAAFKEGVLRIG